MRVFLDANIIVSFLLTKGETISLIFSLLKNNHFTLLTSQEIFAEIQTIVFRLQNLELIRPEETQNLLLFLTQKAKSIETKSRVTISPDLKDNRYLACAKDGQADYLVTGDKKHLLPLKKFHQTKIITAKEFVEILKST